MYCRTYLDADNPAATTATKRASRWSDSPASMQQSLKRCSQRVHELSEGFYYFGEADDKRSDGILLLIDVVVLFSMSVGGFVLV